MKPAATASLAAALVLWSGALCFAQPLRYELPEEVSKFRDGPNLEVAQNNCVACHSADYILTQPPKMGEVFWSNTVHKMINAYKAPIEESDVKAIIAYLVATY